jgi:hypothetical protein
VAKYGITLNIGETFTLHSKRPKATLPYMIHGRQPIITLQRQSRNLDASTSSGSTPNSYFVESGTYVRARNAQVGYTFSMPGLKKAGIQKLRVYASATNLFTITGYSGTDPELNGGVLNFGIDEGTYASSAHIFNRT